MTLGALKVYFNEGQEYLSHYHNSKEDLKDANYPYTFLIFY